VQAYRLLLAGALAAGACGGGIWAYARFSQPRIEVPRVLDVGLQEEGANVVVSFPVQNRGREKLEIDGVQTSCGCLALSRKTPTGVERVERLTLDGGETCELLTRLATPGPSGTHLKQSIAFRTNDPHNPVVAVEIRAEVQGRITVVPQQINLGRIQLSDKHRTTFELRDTGRRAPFALGAVKCSRPDLVESIVARRWEPSDSSSGTDEVGKPLYTVDLVVRAPNQPTTIDAAVEVYEQGHDRPIATAPLRGHTVPLFEVAPSTLVLPRASDTGLMWTGKVRCANTLGKSFALRVRESPPGFTVSVLGRSPNSAFDVRVEAKPGRSSLRETFAIELLAELGTRSEAIELPVTLWRGE
jgi:hypothetical protein